MDSQPYELEFQSHQRFPILFCGDSPSSLVQEICSIIGARRAILCTTPTVAREYADIIEETGQRLGSNLRVMVLPLCEAGKNIDAALGICAEAQRFGIGRRDVLIALGGGVCSDIVRVAAALIRRGVPHICVPTTLIGQIDAGVGIKGAVNFNGSKSYLGVFHRPEATLIWPQFLTTLDAAAWRDGLAEAIKLACIASVRLFRLIDSVADLLDHGLTRRPSLAVAEMVRRCIQVTIDELALDPTEQGNLERLLDFGHSFSPLIESVSGHAISHGRAVAIDMSYSAALSNSMGTLSDDDYDCIIAAVTRCGLPIDCPELDPELIERAIESAVKHRNGHLNLVLPVAIGQCVFLKAPDMLSRAMIDKALARLRMEQPVSPVSSDRPAPRSANHLC